MSAPYAPIYYVSKETIDQIYREQFEPIEKVTKSSATGFSGYIGAQVGLSKLFSIFMDMDGNASAQASSEKVIQEEVARSTVDFTLDMIGELFASDSVVDVENLIDGDVKNQFYSFNLPLTFSIEGDSDGSVYDALLHERNREGVKIRATHEGEGFEISGITSAEKWTTSSILLNFLERIRDEKGTTTEVAGVLHPINVDSDSDMTEVTAQYLFFCSSSAYGD